MSHLKWIQQNFKFRLKMSWVGLANSSSNLQVTGMKFGNKSTVF